MGRNRKEHPPAKFKILIDEDVFELLTKNAGAWDKPNDVIRRLLGLPPRGRKEYK